MVLIKNADITVFNKYYDLANDIEMYQKTVIEGVNWQSKSNGTVTDKGLLLAYSVLIFVDILNNYVSPKVFAKLSDAERVNYFTFAPGDKIVKGVVDFEVAGVHPFRISDLEKEFDDVIDIKSVNKFPSHFEIQGV